MEYNKQSKSPSLATQQEASNQPKQQAPKWWISGILALSFAGFLDSAYLTLQHFWGFDVTCSLVHGCGEVLTSSYATFFGIPIALFGLLYYLTVFVAIIAFIDRENALFLKIAVALPIVGFLFTLWLLFVQAFLLEAFCMYCLISAGLTTGLFLLSAYYLLYGYHQGDR